MKAVEHKHDQGMAAEKQHEQRTEKHEQRTVKQQGHRVVVAQATLYWRQGVQKAALPRMRQTEQRDPEVEGFKRWKTLLWGQRCDVSRCGGKLACGTKTSETRKWEDMGRGPE